MDHVRLFAQLLTEIVVVYVEQLHDTAVHRLAAAPRGRIGWGVASPDDSAYHKDDGDDDEHSQCTVHPSFFTLINNIVHCKSSLFKLLGTIDLEKAYAKHEQLRSRHNSRLGFGDELGEMRAQGDGGDDDNHNTSRLDQSVATGTAIRAALDASALSDIALDLDTSAGM